MRLDRVALRAGEPLSGTVTLAAAAPLRLRGLVVEATGREVVNAMTRYPPPVYEQPVPRWAGRTRSGNARVDYQLREELLAVPVSLPQGPRLFPFRLSLPADALPTYGGVEVVVEHDLLVTAELDRGRVQRWEPVHVWAAPQPPQAAEPIEVAAEATGVLDRWLPGLRAPVELRLGLETTRCELHQPLRGWYEVASPAGTTPKRLALELLAVETCRFRAATDLHTTLVARRVLPLSTAAGRQGFEWHLPPRLAPSLRSPRFRLEWQLRAAVTLPWALGPVVTVPLTLYDAGGAPVGEEPAMASEPCAGES